MIDGRELFVFSPKVNRVIKFRSRDALLEAFFADDTLWNAIVAKFTSFDHVDRPLLLIDKQ